MLYPMYIRIGRIVTYYIALAIGKRKNIIIRHFKNGTLIEEITIPANLSDPIIKSKILGTTPSKYKKKAK